MYSNVKNWYIRSSFTDTKVKSSSSAILYCNSSENLKRLSKEASDASGYTINVDDGNNENIKTVRKNNIDIKFSMICMAQQLLAPSFFNLFAIILSYVLIFAFNSFDSLRIYCLFTGKFIFIS
jgi:hypothetical protein